MLTPSKQLEFVITPQPDEVSCGPACLQSVYRFYGDHLPLEQVIREVRREPGGGTLAVFLALHAIDRGYDATIYTCNLNLFDPSWFTGDEQRLRQRMLMQMRVKNDPKLTLATHAYLEFLDRGGELIMDDITVELISEFLHEETPIIAGLSATWLYRCPRDRQTDMKPDDVGGEPTGHFVVLHGVDHEVEQVDVADPYLQHPYPGTRTYSVTGDRLVGAILLGIVTYDAKLLVIKPAER